ncbi:hypothetical protein SLEP1_g54450 [Rubroshorea leprosula]|uniref:Uncharacterized protein n=1 Tax=Rubroshorea leprosula TaxID=152421 RepID=A0AAV5MCF2_9ROSI|nr:hypothetical protein SLEP1_g54450 [Rubroshorea leprosula]
MYRMMTCINELIEVSMGLCMLQVWGKYLFRSISVIYEFPIRFKDLSLNGANELTKKKKKGQTNRPQFRSH